MPNQRTVSPASQYGLSASMMKNGEDPKPQKLFEYIRAYHELLAIIAVLVGFVMWTVGYFATKSEVKEIREISERQVQKLRCLLRLNIEWLAGEQVWKIGNDEITKIEQDIRTVTPLAGVLPDVATMHRIVELERQREERKKDLDIARLQKTESKNRLMQGGCEQ
jgi:hypothetical protein